MLQTKIVGINKLVSVTFFLFIFCDLFGQSRICGAGVLRIDLLKLTSNRKVNVYNENGSVFATIYKNKETEECEVSGVGKNSIKYVRAFFPDYGILMFDANSLKLSGKVNVYIKNQIKYVNIKEVKSFSNFQIWNIFLKNVFVKVNDKSGIYTDTTSLRKIPKAENYSYSVKKISGDWIWVECLKTCEECPKGKQLAGWIRWKRNDILLIDFYYFC